MGTGKLDANTKTDDRNEAQNTLPFAIDPDQDTICDVIRCWAEVQPDAVAFLEESRPSLTYRALVDAMDGVRRDLNEAGFGRGDRVALIHRGGQSMASLIFGIVGCATLLPLNPNHTTEELRTHLRHRRANALVLEPDAAPAARETAAAIGIPVFFPSPKGDGLRPANGGAFPARTPGEEHGPAKSGDVAIVLPTSGTTSAPKLVPFRHRLVLLRALSENLFFKRNSADICLCPQRLYYANGLNQMMSSLSCGSTLALAPSFTAETFFHYLREFGLTCVSASVPFLHRIHESMGAFEGRGRAHSLRYIRATSGFLDPALAGDLEAFFGVPIVENYSSSETCRVCCNPIPPRVRKRGTVGPPSDCEVRIRALDGRFVQSGERGEIVVRGVRIIEGYENDADANRDAFVDGWFRTGDEGVFDEDGYLTLTGRIKEMINRGGEKVSPAEIDAAVTEHPGVSEAATFPIPHPTLGEEVAVAVVRTPESGVTEGALIKFLLGRLMGFKVPRRVHFVDQIPKSDAGRVQRYKLAESLGVLDETAPSQRPQRAASPLEFRLQRIWQQVLKVRHVDLDDNFFLLGGDSLLAVELFLRIEEALGRRLPTACLFEAGTISELAELLQKEEPQGCMIAIREEGNKPPFFCVHGFGGEAITFFNIARHLGSDQPFYGIESLGWDGRTVPFTKTADMAAHYVAEIQNIQPNGPYYLGGYSFGGRVAVYMANMLKDAGEEVALLVLIDPVSLLGTSHVKLHNWLELKEAKGLVDVICQAGGYAYFKLRKATNNHLLFPLARAVLFPIWEHYRKTQKLLPRILRRPDNANRLMRMEQRKLPDYLGAAIYLQAQRSRIPRQSGELASWKGIVKEDLTVIPLACSHYEIVREPHSVALAKEIRRALDAAYLMATPSNSK